MAETISAGLPGLAARQLRTGGVHLRTQALSAVQPAFLEWG